MLSDKSGVSFNDDLPYDFGVRVALNDTFSNGKFTPASSEDRGNRRLVKEALRFALNKIEVVFDARVSDCAVVVVFCRVQAAQQRTRRAQSCAYALDKSKSFNPREVVQGQTGDDDADFAGGNWEWSANVPDVKLGLRGRMACAFYCARRQVDRDYAKTRFDQDCCVFTDAAAKLEDQGSDGAVVQQRKPVL